MCNKLDLHIDKFTNGVFPWNEQLGYEFKKRVKNIKGKTVVDLCSGTGNLGVEVANTIGAKRVVLYEINHASCQEALRIWKNLDDLEIHVIEADILSTPPFLDYPGVVVVSNPPHAPLPDSFSDWRNAYGGKDGLMFVRAIFDCLLKCQQDVPFLIATYFLSKEISLTISDVLKGLDKNDPGIKNIYHFNKPTWNWIGIDEKDNPSRSENVLSWYLDYCNEDEKMSFLKYLKEHPYIHHILIEGITLRY